ncbi:MAG: DNA mismatch repair protein MutL, partial [Ferruginibacter sp.]
SAVKHALAQFSITPTLDFELDASIQSLDAVSKPFTDENKSAASASSLYNTFTKKHQSHFIESKSELKHWKALSGAEGYEPGEKLSVDRSSLTGEDFLVAGELHTNNQQRPTTENLLQLHNTFIIVQTSKGYYLVHQQNAHERILYERFALAVEGKPIATQQSLFPATIELASADAVLLKELLPDMNHLGYLLEPFGNNTFVIQGTPADVNQGSEKMAIEKMLEQYKHFSNDLKFSKREKLLRSLALQQSVKAGTALTEREMKVLVEDLFNCSVPNSTANGKPTYLEFKKEELDKLFGR